VNLLDAKNNNPDVLAKRYTPHSERRGNEKLAYRCHEKAEACVKTGEKSLSHGITAIDKGRRSMIPPANLDLVRSGRTILAVAL
jgi:hypothetical protein